MQRIELDNSALRAAAQEGSPVEVVDPQTGQAFYLVSSEQYQKIKATFSGETNPQFAYPLVDQVMAEDDADDPLLDSYQ